MKNYDDSVMIDYLKDDPFYQSCESKYSNFDWPTYTAKEIYLELVSKSTSFKLFQMKHDIKIVSGSDFWLLALKIYSVLLAAILLLTL